MAGAFEAEVNKGVAACKILTTEVASLSKGVKTHAGNYDNACNMLYASEDMLEELKAKVKAGKDPKAPAELEKWEGNHPKLGSRVKATYAEVEKLRAGVKQAGKAEETIKGTLEKLNKDAARASMADIKATASGLKGMATSLAAANKEIKRLDTVLENCVSFPKSL